MKRLGLLFMVLSLVLALVSCQPEADEDQGVYDAAYTALSLVVTGGELDSVISAFTVPTALRGDVVAIWTSSDSVHANITTAGALTTVNVVRPLNGEGDADVTLTAALTYNDITGTKTFDITILEEPEGVVIMTLSEIRGSTMTYGTTSAESTSAVVGETVRINDVTVSGIDSDGYYISDGSAALFIFGAPGPTIVLNQKGSVLATVGIYYGAFQLSNVTWSNVTQSTAITPTQVDLSDYWVAADVTVQTLVDTKNNLVLTGLVTFDAVVVYREDFTGGSNYMLTLVDPVTAVTSHDTNFVLSYYKGPLHDELAAYDGLTLTFTAISREIRDARATNDTIGTRPIFSLAIQTMVVPVLTEAQKALVDKNSIKIETDFIADGRVMLPTTGAQGSTITWAYTTDDHANNHFVNLITGIITIDDELQVESYLTATVVNGDTTETRDFVLVIGQFPISDISDVQDDTLFEDGDTIRVIAVVTALTKTGGFWMQDATGGLNIYTYGEYLDTLNDLTLGSEVEMIGELDIYNGLFEIKNLTFLEVTDTAVLMPTPASLNDVEFTDIALLPYQGTLVSFEGFALKYEVTATSGSFSATFYNPADGSQISARVESTLGTYAATLAFLTSLDADDPVDVTGAIMGWYKGYQLAVTSSTNFSAGAAIAEADFAAYAVSKLDLPDADAVVKTISMPATGLFGSTIVWTSTVPAVIAIDGTVTRPAIGAADVTVTIGYTLTLGGTDLTGSVAVVVPALEPASVASDLFISEYVEGGGYSKAIEIFNGTGADVDLSTYKLVQFNNGSQTVSYTFDLTGTLVDGDVIVVVNDAAAQAVLDVADLTQTGKSGIVLAFNGDDCVALTKNDVIIDLIGINDGVDPGSYWAVGTGTTQDHTLVRNETVSGPVATWDTDEWDVYAKDTFTYLDSHTME